MPYPLFLPPSDLGTRSPHEWTDSDAERYREWLSGVVEQRVATLLSYLRESMIGDPPDVLRRLGGKVHEALNDPEFSNDTEEGRVLTDAGYALVADMGLLVAKLLSAKCGRSLTWTTVTSPKTDASFHLPVMTGSGNYRLDPIGASLGHAWASLRGEGSPNAWLDIFEFAGQRLCHGEAP